MMNAIRVVLLGEIYVPPSLFSSKPESAETTLTRGMDGRSLREMHPNIQRLTRRQLGVLALIGQGLSNRDIAENLNISEGTVKVHVGAILKTLGVSNRTRAALLVTELGLPQEEPEEADKVMARPAHQ
jgi:DNA-binding NarL/FixJ family response regulator